MSKLENNTASLQAMAEKINDVGNEVNTQSELIAQVRDALEGKAISTPGGNGYRSFPNGMEWTQAKITADETLYSTWDVCYANGRWFVASPESGNVTSTNGKEWVSHGPGSQSNDNGNGVWSNGSFYFREGGLWDRCSPSIPSNAYSVKYANGLWCAGGDFGIYYSSDGIAWHATNIDSSVSIENIKCEDGIWVASAWDNIYYSQNGITYTPCNMPSDAFNSRKYLWELKISYGNGTWVATSGERDMSEGFIMYSTNGIDWHISNVATDDTFPYYSYAAYANGLWVVCEAMGSQYHIYHSTDGITWTEAGAVQGMFYKITYAEGMWLAAGTYEGGIYYSTDGAAWTRCDGLGDFIVDIEHANGIWVACSQEGNIYYSVTWEPSI